METSTGTAKATFNADNVKYLDYFQLKQLLTILHMRHRPNTQGQDKESD